MRWGVLVSCIGVATAALGVPMALVWSTPACADSWALPEVEAYISKSGKCRLTVMPRDLTSQLDYFEDAIAGSAKPGQRQGGADGPRAILERRNSDGSWRPLWGRALVNDVAPVEALIGERADFVVTFDNWHSVGYGEDAIVIYGIADGGTRKLSVERLLGADFFAALPRSISSIRWRRGAHVKGNSLIVDVLVPKEIDAREPAESVTLAIDMPSGKAVERNPLAWKEARASAARVNATRRAIEEADRAARTAPLLGPRSNNLADWSQYLREAFFRVDPDWEDRYPETIVVPRPGASNYRASIDHLNESLGDEYVDVVMIAGQDEAALLHALEDVSSKLGRGSLRKAKIYVALPLSARARLDTLFARSGAKPILLDPSDPIPQRPERLPEEI